MIMQQQEPTTSYITTAGPQKEVPCLLILYLTRGPGPLYYKNMFSL